MSFSVLACMNRTQKKCSQTKETYIILNIKKINILYVDVGRSNESATNEGIEKFCLCIIYCNTNKIEKKVLFSCRYFVLLYSVPLCFAQNIVPLWMKKH